MNSKYFCRVLLFAFIIATSVLCENVGWLEYLSDNNEEFHDIPLTWENGSQVPSWLYGTYVRNGPGQRYFGSEKRQLNNWMDGFAKIHSFKFNGEKVLFSGKMLESPNYLASVEKGELVPQMTLNQFIDEENDWNYWESLEIFSKFADRTAFDNFNPVVWRYGEANIHKGIYMATTDSPGGLRFNISDLSTLEMYLPNVVPPTTSGCAHPMREPGTDNTINFMSKIGLTGTPYIEIQRYRPHDDFQEPQIIATFEPAKTALVHSFSLTQDNIVLFMYPLDVNPTEIFAKNYHLMEAVEWDATVETDIYVINRHTAEITHLTTEPMFALHHANAYQKNEDEIVVDLCQKGHNAMHDYLLAVNMLNPPETSDWEHVPDDEFSRWTLNLATGKVIKSIFVNEVDNIFVNMLDFPKINEQYRGLEYCYLYAESIVDYTRTAIVKKNVCDPSKDVVWYKENHYVSEVWFFPTPASERDGELAEDDGVLMTLVYDGEKRMSYMMLLDAMSMETIAISYLPHRVPWSAHGHLFPEAQF